MNLKEQANQYYYNTEENLITDNEFDLLADNGLEINNFHKKVKHLQPCGSLKKIKNEKDFLSWTQGKPFTVTPKLDGNSLEIVFERGRIVKAITRGNGYVGNDVTDKVLHCHYMGIKLFEGSLKCEAIIPKQYKKDRSVVAGLLNKKEIDIYNLNLINIIPLIFFTPIETNYDYESLKTTFNYYKENYHYEIDGLVLSLDEPIYEETNELLPNNTIALKFNKEGELATIKSIEWNLGKHGIITPVLILETPVVIDGTNVNRVYASNYGIIKAAGLGVDAKVKVIKSGDIIPQVSEVITPSNNIVIPVCPFCNNELIVGDVHLICNNCKNNKLIYMYNFFDVLNVEYISDKTIKKLYDNGYGDVVSIFNLNVNEISKIEGFASKTASYIVNSLKNITLNEYQVIQCAMVEGIGKKQSQSLINHFGSLKKFIDSLNGYDYTVIDGFGEILHYRIIDNVNKFKDTLDTVNKCNIQILSYKDNDEKLKIAMTGKWKLSRKEIVDKLEEMGYTYHDSVKKDTDLLLVADINDLSDKIKKAQKNGTKIVSYDEFLN